MGRAACVPTGHRVYGYHGPRGHACHWPRRRRLVAAPRRSVGTCLLRKARCILPPLWTCMVHGAQAIALCARCVRRACDTHGVLARAMVDAERFWARVRVMCRPASGCAHKRHEDASRKWSVFTEAPLVWTVGWSESETSWYPARFGDGTMGRTASRVNWPVRRVVVQNARCIMHDRCRAKGTMHNARRAKGTMHNA